MERAMPRATPSLLTQLDCENADANIKDGRPAARLLTLGGGPCLQITPGKLQADGRYALSKYWLFSYSLEGHAHRIGLGSCDKLPLDRARVEALLLQKQVENASGTNSAKSAGSKTSSSTRWPRNIAQTV